MIKTRSPKKGRGAAAAPSKIVSVGELAPSFDLSGELLANETDYTCGDKWLAMTKFPNYLRTSLDRVRARMMPPKPEVSAVLSACVRYGVRSFYANADIQAFQAIKERYSLSHDDVDPDEAVDLDLFFKHCPLTIPDWHDSGLKRQNVTIPEPIKKELDHLASEIGCTASDLSTFAVMVALADQPGVLEAWRVAMIEAIQGFYSRMSRRRGKAEDDVARALGESR